MTIDDCYEPRLDNNGNVIIKPAFKAKFRQFYKSQGWAIPALLADRGTAMDAAPAEDAVDDRYADLNRDYERLLTGSGQPTIRRTVIDDDFEGRAEATRGRAAVVHAGFGSRDPVDEARLFAEFKRARAWDRASDETLRNNFDLERSYRELLEASQPLPGSPSEGGL
jgi:hypothetical protein